MKNRGQNNLNDAISSMAVNSWINKNRVIWPEIDLSGIIFPWRMNMTFCEIPGANLTKSHFSQADFRWSNLKNVNLHSSSWFWSKIEFVDLSEAKYFQYSNFTNCCFMNGCEFNGEIIRRYVSYLDYSLRNIYLFLVKDKILKDKKLSYKIFFDDQFYTFEEFQNCIEEKSFDEADLKNLKAALEFFEVLAWSRE